MTADQLTLTVYCEQYVWHLES